MTPTLKAKRASSTSGAPRRSKACSLDDSATTFKTIYDVTQPGNFDGHNILNRLNHPDLLNPSIEANLKAARQTLFEHRQTRTPPSWDDKVLADWNGLMIAALAEAGLLLARPDWVAIATSAFEAVMSLLWHDARLHHAWRAGKIRHLATADGYANLITAAIYLREATGHTSWISQAEKLFDALEQHHWDSTTGGYFFASSSADNLIIRPKFAYDDATPNANAVMLSNLAKLHVLTGKKVYRNRARQIHNAFAGAVRHNLIAHATFLSGFQDMTDLVQIIILSAPDHEAEADNLRNALLAYPLPSHLVMKISTLSELPVGHAAHGKPTPVKGACLYICRGETCSIPVSRPAEIAAALAVIGLSTPKC